MSEVIILGAGMAGLGACHRLRSEGLAPIIFERKNYYGGHATSFEKDGFIFDDGPHISFTSNERLRKIFHEAVDHDVYAFAPKMNNYWKGHWIKHPAQVNLHGLPADMVATIIEEIFHLSQEEDEEQKNYRDWLYANYGKTFSDTFPISYAKKYHTVDAEKMDVDWIGPRMYKPNVREVLLGSLQKETEDVYYVKNFFYPNQGGFVSFLKSLAPETGLNLSHKLIKLVPATQLLEFENGYKCNYQQLISSLPLPELIRLIEGVPDDIHEAAQQLACSQCVTVNLGVNRSDISDVHWSYFYDDDVVFSRISFPHMLSPNNVPANYGSIQAEIYFSKKYKPLEVDIASLIEPTITDLLRCGVLHESDEIIYQEARKIPYANVIFDLDRQSALSAVHGYLDDIGIQYCGRFGDWGYHWTDDAFFSGEGAAQRVLEQV